MCQLYYSTRPSVLIRAQLLYCYYIVWNFMHVYQEFSKSLGSGAGRALWLWKKSLTQNRCPFLWERLIAPCRMREPSRVTLPPNKLFVFLRKSALWVLQTWSFFLKRQKLDSGNPRCWAHVWSPSLTEWLEHSYTCHGRCSVTNDKGYLISINWLSNFVYLVVHCFFHGELSLGP